MPWEADELHIDPFTAIGSSDLFLLDERFAACSLEQAVYGGAIGA